MEQEREQERWLTAGGLSMIRGLRRRMDEKGVAAAMGVSLARLRRWALENEDIKKALEIDGQMANFLVEDTVFNKALAGDQKAIEFWLKRGGQPERQLVDYTSLADLINN